jgi:YbbR domain-containing protein
MSKERKVRDNTIKILSVIFATLLWFYVITEQNPVVPKDITIPVKIVNAESLNRNNLVLLDNTGAYYVTLKLKGKKELLDTVDQNTVNAYADVSNYTTVGENTVPVVISGIPEGISVTSRSEHNIKVILDKKLVTQMPVSASITGNPKGGLAYLAALLSPSEVILTGAESIINTIKTAEVDIDIAGADVSINKRLPVRLLDESGRDVYGVQLNTQFIDVSVPISNTKRVPIQLVLEGAPAEGYMIAYKEIQPKEILVTGTQQALDSLIAINTTKVSINNLTENITLKVTLDMPPEIQLANANEQINAVFDIQKVVTDTVDISDIEYKNLDPKYIVDNAPARTVRVTVRGPEKLLKDLQSNLNMYVDLTNAKVGAGTYEILVNKLPLLEVLSIEPSDIGLDIKIRE